MQNPKLKVVSNIIPHLKNTDRVVFNFWGSPLPPSNYSTKVRFWQCYEAQIVHFGQGIFKIMLQSTRKKCNKWGIYI